MSELLWGELWGVPVRRPSWLAIAHDQLYLASYVNLPTPVQQRLCGIFDPISFFLQQGVVPIQLSSCSSYSVENFIVLMSLCRKIPLVEKNFLTIGVRFGKKCKVQHS